jgi:hypothetical protein
MIHHNLYCSVVWKLSSMILKLFTASHWLYVDWMSGCIKMLCSCLRGYLHHDLLCLCTWANKSDTIYLSPVNMLATDANHIWHNIDAYDNQHMLENIPLRHSTADVIPWRIGVVEMLLEVQLYSILEDPGVCMLVHNWWTTGSCRVCLVHHVLNEIIPYQPIIRVTGHFADNPYRRHWLVRSRTCRTWFWQLAI